MTISRRKFLEFAGFLPFALSGCGDILYEEKRDRMGPEIEFYAFPAEHAGHQDFFPEKEYRNRNIDNIIFRITASDNKRVERVIIERYDGNIGNIRLTIPVAEENIRSRIFRKDYSPSDSGLYIPSLGVQTYVAKVSDGWNETYSQKIIVELSGDGKVNVFNTVIQ